MGACASSNEHAKAAAIASKAIDENLLKLKEKEDMKTKILLLGAGDSGKSTIIKQFKIIHLQGFTDEEARGYRVAIHRNIIFSLQILIQATTKVAFASYTGKISANKQEYVKSLLRMSVDERLTEDKAKIIKQLWRDSAIQKAMTLAGKLELEGSMNYFMSRIDLIGHEDYIPNVDDILNARIRTTGVHNLTFSVDGLDFQCIDVGGQRNERKKWISHFDDVDAILFIASLSEYDGVLREDGKTNRMLESNRLFKEICSSPYFLKTNIILFLNKRDLFAEKIKKIDLKKCYKDYTGGLDYDDALHFIKEKYENIREHYHNQQDKKKQSFVYTHVTCATDTKNVEFVFNACKHIIITGSLTDLGMI